MTIRGSGQGLLSDDAAARLRALSDDARVKVGRAGLRAAARVLRDESRRKVPVQTGASRAAIKVRSRGGEVQVVYGGPGARQWYILEFGREAGKKGDHRYGWARPFLYIHGPLERTGAEQAAAMAAAMEKAIDRWASRTRRTVLARPARIGG